MNFVFALFVSFGIILLFRRNTLRSLSWFLTILLLLPLASRLSLLFSWQLGESDYLMSIYNWLGLLFFLVYIRSFLKMLNRVHVVIFALFTIYLVIIVMQFFNPINYSVRARIWGFRDIVCWIGFVSAYTVWIRNSKVSTTQIISAFRTLFLLATFATIYSMIQVHFGFTLLDELFLTRHGFAIDDGSQPFNPSIMLDGQPRFLQTSVLSNKYLVQVYLFLFFVFLKKHIHFKRLGYLFSSIFIIGLLLNLERSPIILIILSLAAFKFFFYLFSEKKYTRVLLTSIGTIAFGITLFSVLTSSWFMQYAESNTVARRLMNITNYEDDPAIYGRILWWIDIYIPRIISNSFGYGLGAVSEHDPEIMSGLRPPPHNFFIYYAYEIGVIGLLFFLLILFGLMYKSLKTFNTRPQTERQFVSFSIAVIFANIFEGFANIPFTGNDVVLSSLIISIMLSYQFGYLNDNTTRSIQTTAVPSDKDNFVNAT